MHKLVLWIQTVLVPLLGAPGMFLMAFLDSSFLSFPEINDILLITSSHIHPERAWLYVTMTTLGSVLGCHTMWMVGRRGGEALLARRFGSDRVERTRHAFRRWGILTIAVPSVLPPPMPFKIFVIAAGVFDFSPRRMAITLLISRGLRFTFWAAMGALYGDEALAWLERFDGWFARHWAWVVMVVGLLVVAALIVHWARGLRARRARPGAEGA
jgi:membrane protein YqaA with SNARE-associated domain